MRPSIPIHAAHLGCFAIFSIKRMVVMILSFEFMWNTSLLLKGLQTWLVAVTLNVAK